MGIKVVTGSQYLGVFVGDRSANDIWLEEKVQVWTELVKTLLGVAYNHLLSSYAVLQKLLQQEWALVQRVTPNIRDVFGLVEQALWDAFMPALFQGMGDGTPGRGVTRLPVKQAVHNEWRSGTQFTFN